MVLTGADGELRWRSQRCAKVRSWTLTINRDAIDESCLGQTDRTYITGLRSATGSASLFYDPTDNASRRMLNTIFEDDGKPEDVSFVLNTTDGRQFKCDVFLTNVSASVEVGAAHAVSVSFQVSGPIDGRF